jgi:Putative bacterial sensory transduction regulator
MADESQNQDRISGALQALRLNFRYEPRTDGRGLWHVPFDLADGSSARLTIYSGPLVAGVLCVVGDLSANWRPPTAESILRMNADLWLTKLIAQDNLVSVTAQLPANQVDSESLRLAIAGVLDGVSRIRSTTPNPTNEPTSAPDSPDPKK